MLRGEIKTMSFTADYIGFTPDFCNFALSGVNYRFLLVLECESRPTGTDPSTAVNHPRFCVGGHRAIQDPRNISITELQPLDPHKIEIPLGWEKVHQLIYVVETNTDPDGWQYRSEWPIVALANTDEQWSNQSANANVRRRLWMTTVVMRDDVLIAKRKISELIQSYQRGQILVGPLLRLEENASNEKSWVVRKAALMDEKIELYHEQVRFAVIKPMSTLPNSLTLHLILTILL